LAIYSDWADLNPVISIFSPLLIFWILIFDMVHITLFRVLRGQTRTFREWLEYVGHDHLHHRMAKVLGSPTKSILFIFSMTICLSLNALVLRRSGPFEAFLLLCQALLLVVLVSVLEAKGGNAIANGGADQLSDHRQTKRRVQRIRDGTQTGESDHEEGQVVSASISARETVN
jgi:hypothetical protein